MIQRLLPLLAFCIVFGMSGCRLASPSAGASRISGQDGMPQQFVPAGEFWMGAAAQDPEANPDERPRHLVFLDAFWMDQTEVTWEMYLQCVAAEGCSPIRTRQEGPAANAFPVQGASWNQAEAYCRWAGRRLPTEAEWEKAAAGSQSRSFPWGDEEPDGARANFGGLLEGPAAVGQFAAGASPYGVLDLAGNVWEWVADWYDGFYYSRSESVNPTGPETGRFRVLRGGAWNAVPGALRVTNRFFGYPLVNHFDGFRCAESAPSDG
jgi:formylglycine-generating enzyme required for sulfatase activity